MDEKSAEKYSCFQERGLKESARTSFYFILKLNLVIMFSFFLSTSVAFPKRLEENTQITGQNCKGTQCYSIQSISMQRNVILNLKNLNIFI